jgi:hypothetical protein
LMIRSGIASIARQSAMVMDHARIGFMGFAVRVRDGQDTTAGRPPGSQRRLTAFRSILAV